VLRFKTTNLACGNRFTQMACLIIVLVGVSLSAGVADIHLARAGEALEIGKPAPDFMLTDTEGQSHRLSDYTGKGFAVVLEWFNPDCPFIKKHHQDHTTMNDLFAEVKDQKVVWLAK